MDTVVVVPTMIHRMSSTPESDKGRVRLLESDVACTHTTLDAADCDYGDNKACSAGLTCGVNNCKKFHPDLAAAGMTGPA